jgi:hypothetical protein
MRFYQVHMTHEAGESAGYSYHTSKRDAEQAMAHWRSNDPGPDLDHDASITEIEIRPTKAGILSALKRFASHNDNG